MEKRRKLDASIPNQLGADQILEDEKIAEVQQMLSELEQMILQKEDQLRAHVAKISKLESSLKVAKRKKDELEALEKAFLKVLENYAEIRGDCGMVGPKQIGFVNIEEDWSMNDLIIDDELMTFWEARVVFISPWQ